MEQTDFSDFFKTKAQANDFVNRLASISQQVYQADFNLENVLMEQFGLQKKDTFLRLLREKKVNLDVHSLKEFLDKLQTTVTALPLVSLTLAFEPQEQTLKLIADWFLLNIGKSVLFDIKVDKNLIAGAALFYNGKYLDFSIKPKFERVLKNTLEKSASSISEAVKPITQVSSPNINHISVESLSLGR